MKTVKAFTLTETIFVLAVALAVTVVVIVEYFKNKDYDATEDATLYAHTENIKYSEINCGKPNARGFAMCNIEEHDRVITVTCESPKMFGKHPGCKPSP